jgi:biotin transport system substrate-specific component
LTATIGQPERHVLADLLPAAWWRNVALVVSGTLLVALASQVRIPLGFTPVPITGGTFAVLVVGAALGAGRGAVALAAYVLCGIAGLPFFAGGESGWTYATGSSGGYLLGFFWGAVVAGALAERRHDRRVRTAVPAMLAATAVIYLLGAVWLAHVVGVPLLGWADSAFALGVRPFLVGDALKLALAGLLLPTAWRFVGVVGGRTSSGR